MSQISFDIEAYLDRLKAAAKKALFSIEPFGITQELPLLALTREGQTPDHTALEAPTARIYLSAGIHGDEPAGPLALLRLLNERWFSPDISWYLLPLLNPVGISLNQRENAEGADLNRDYFQARSLEVAAHLKWMESRFRGNSIDISILLHEDWEARGFYLYEVTRDFERSVARDALDAASQVLPIEMGTRIDGRVAQKGRIAPLEMENLSLEGDDLPGAEAIFLSKTYSELNYTFETPTDFPIADRVDAHVRAIKGATRAFLQLPGKPPFENFS